MAKKKKNVAQRVVSRAKTSGNLKNASLKSRIQAVITEMRKP